MKSERAKFWTRWAYKRGYRVLDDGTLLGPSGNKMSPSPSSIGYPTFRVGPHKGQYTLQLHVFAAYCWYGETAIEAECVRHRDDVRTNCTRENIRVGTRVDNAQDIPKHVRVRRGHHMLAGKLAKGAAQRKVRDAKIMRMFDDGAFHYEIAEEIGLARGTVTGIIHVGLGQKRKR